MVDIRDGVQWGNPWEVRSKEFHPTHAIDTPMPSHTPLALVMKVTQCSYRSWMFPLQTIGRRHRSCHSRRFVTKKKNIGKHDPFPPAPEMLDLQIPTIVSSLPLSLSPPPLSQGTPPCSNIKQGGDTVAVNSAGLLRSFCLCSTFFFGGKNHVLIERAWCIQWIQ